MSSKFRYEDIKLEFEQRGYQLISPEYIGLDQKLEYICTKHAEHGPQYIDYKHFRYRHSGCKYCGHERTSNKKRITADVVRPIAESRGWEYISLDYSQGRTMVKVVCPFHRDRGVQNVLWTVIQQGKSGCKFCANNVKLTHQEFCNRVHAQIPHVEVLSLYSSQINKVSVRCKKHDIVWDALPATLYAGVGCYLCHREIISRAQTVSREERIAELNRYNPTIQLASDETRNGYEVVFRCNICNREITTKYANMFYHGIWCCPWCSISRGEQKILGYLENKSISFEIHKKFDGLVGVGGRGLSYDFYLPDHNLLIEYQGEFHDGTPVCQTNEAFLTQQEHDARKKNYAKLYGIKLLEIWYHDFYNIDSILDTLLAS